MTPSAPGRRRSTLVTLLPLALALVLSTAGLVATPASQAEVRMRIAMGDGVTLAATLDGASGAPVALPARPTVVEFTPYGALGASYDVPGDYHYLVVQIRGTGDSNGSFDALGPRSQRDVVEALRWACDQPWSNGRLAVAGFSASAIMIFNSLHQDLPCVEAAVLRSGTFELYRDLLVPGGIPNTAAGLAVLAMIGAPALMAAPDRLRRDPLSGLAAVYGMAYAGFHAGLLHPTLDAWWRERGFRGDVNSLPTLFLDGAFDVEPRGDYQGFQALREQGADPQLLVVGAHDGAPGGTDNGQRGIERWLARYLLDVDNGVEDEPAVQMLLADGDREDMLAGRFVRYEADEWPAAGTMWQTLWLDAERAGTTRSINDGSLVPIRAARGRTQSYLAAPSLTTATDPNITGTISGGPDGGLNQLLTYLPFLSDMDLTNLTGLTFTSAPLSEDVVSVGPANLVLRMSSLLPTTNVWAVISDVDPSGTAHPMTVGRLNTAYPGVVTAKSLVRDGQIVQPYGDYSRSRPAVPGVARNYQVEFWPVANRFKKGHRVQLSIVGPSATMFPSLPSLNNVTIGGAQGSRLLFPVAPASGVVTAPAG
ncbi:CocE/NonD family hydrolase [Nocardioides sp. R-C-SC26]|uniref:CocE/NonD family hydrolase n=1 Tax=Nocardioides sp. R-C-SC26 TaxID=2870414 RepID=UPI001E429618|nr:CocE/NonD family hydrolase [Nocardioides sp. R-C-SC26]